MTDRRQISAAELDTIFALAAAYEDLRVIPKMLSEVTELREQVANLRKVAMGGQTDEVKPKSVTDLLRLEKAGHLTAPTVRKMLGIQEVAPVTATTEATRADEAPSRREWVAAWVRSDWNLVAFAIGTCLIVFTLVVWGVTH